MCMRVGDGRSGLGRRLLGCFSHMGVMVGLACANEPS